MICGELIMNDLSTSSIFHVINTKTSNKLLLRRSWLHEHGITASIKHQFLKYYRSKERKINDNVKSFTKAESYFVDVRFFDKDDAPNKTMRLTITSKGKGGKENALQAPNDDIPEKQLKKEESK